MKNFLKQLLLFSGALAILIFLWNTFLPEKFKAQELWIVLVFLSVITLGVHAFLTNPANTPQQFVRSFMLITFLKLFVYLIIIGVYAYLNREQAVKFILSFLVLYFVFMIFEVATLTKFVRKKD